MNQFSPEGLEKRLDRLFEDYRDACIVPDASAHFMPSLWSRIEARRRFQLDLGRWARGLATLAAAASLGIAILLVLPNTRSELSMTYIEALAEEHAPERLVVQDVAFFDATPENGSRGPSGR